MLPDHFNRTISSIGHDYDFRNTSTTDASFGLLEAATFLVFDQNRGLEFLGSQPTHEFIFQVSTAIHEAPVYIPAQNKLYLSQMLPGVVTQLVIDLSPTPPTLGEITFDPPVFAPGGAAYYNGELLVGTTGSNISEAVDEPASLRLIDTQTNQSTALLNNYFGFHFNGIDDLAVHPQSKQIYFTDPTYGWYGKISNVAPQLPVASYRFDPATGAVFMIDDTMSEPNGIAFSPDGQTLYISDTSADSPIGDPANGTGGVAYITTNKRGIYAFDVTNNGTKISNRRAFYLAQDWIPDGVKVSREGLVLTSSGHGVDVLDPNGQLLIRVQTNYTVVNFAWTGKNLKTLWLVGQGGISKVEWNVTGQALI